MHIANGLRSEDVIARRCKNLELTEFFIAREDN